MNSGTFCGQIVILALPVVMRGNVARLIGVLSGVVINHINAMRVGNITVTGRLVFIFGLYVFKTISNTNVFKTRCRNRNSRGKIRRALHFGLLVDLTLLVTNIAIFLLTSRPLVALCLGKRKSPTSTLTSLHFNGRCLHVVLVNLIPFSFIRYCSNALQRANGSALPVVTNIMTIIAGLYLGCILVFNRFNTPGLKIINTTVTAIVSHFIRLTVIIVTARTHPATGPFMMKLCHDLRVPHGLTKRVIIGNVPLVFGRTT